MRDRTSQLVVGIYGPTSSGKTSLALELGERLRGDRGLETVVISADSRQVYKYMDIGTSKATESEIARVPHEMLDVTEPRHKLELETYTTRARQLIQHHLEKGRVPLIVGGTGTYVSALIEDWDVAGTASLRATLARDFPRGMAEDAHATLERLDKAAAAKVHPNNYEAVLNALVAAMSGPRGQKSDAGPHKVVFGIDRPAETLDARIAATFDLQLERGLLEEITSLTERYDLDEEIRRHGGTSDNQVLHTHGYREFFEYAAGQGKAVADLTGTDLDEVRAMVLDHIWAYSRRQRTWFRKLPDLEQVRNADQAWRILSGGGPAERARPRSVRPRRLT